MKKSTIIRSGRHCVFNMHVHLVFVTKYRHKVFESSHLDALKQIFEKVCNDFESALIEFNGEQEYVHLLIEYPPKHSVSKLVNSLKGASSYRLKRLFPELQKTAYLKNALWAPSYFSGSCGGAPISIIKKYIEDQTRPA